MITATLFCPPPLLPASECYERIRVQFITPNFLVHKQDGGIKSLPSQLCGNSFKERRNKKRLFLSHPVAHLFTKKKKKKAMDHKKRKKVLTLHFIMQESAMLKSQTAFGIWHMQTVLTEQMMFKVCL